MPVGGGGARPRCWSVAGPGRASHSDLAPLVWRAPECPEGLAAVPVGGGSPARRPRRELRSARRLEARPGPPTTPVAYPQPTRFVL